MQRRELIQVFSKQQAIDEVRMSAQSLMQAMRDGNNFAEIDRVAGLLKIATGDFASSETALSALAVGYAHGQVTATERLIKKGIHPDTTGFAAPTLLAETLQRICDRTQPGRPQDKQFFNMFLAHGAQPDVSISHTNPETGQTENLRLADFARKNGRPDLAKSLDYASGRRAAQPNHGIKERQFDDTGLHTAYFT